MSRPQLAFVDWKITNYPIPLIAQYGFDKADIKRPAEIEDAELGAFYSPRSGITNTGLGFSVPKRVWVTLKIDTPEPCSSRDAR
jgi:hypothetical protein